MSARSTLGFVRVIAQRWLPLAVGIAAMSLLVCAAVQQDLRLSANDPQIQMAEDAAWVLEQGQTFEVPSGQLVDVARSLAPFVIVFGEDGKPRTSNGVLEGTTPVPPAGVFAFTREHGQDRITWQPLEGVRIAAVIVHFGGSTPGFVLAGRSLREVESRSSIVLQLAAAACLAALVATLLVVVFFALPWPRETAERPPAEA
jgi:hypothetical protein